MAVITLKELVSLNRQHSSPLANFQTSKQTIQQQQFQLLVRQKRMGLNIKPLLNPQLALWLEQLESFIPGIFESRKKIYLDSRWKAQLKIDEANYWLEVPINAGVVKTKVRLYEWRIGSAKLNWSDRVKLWVACRYLHLQYQPEDLWMVICAFSSQHNSYIQKLCWNQKDDRTIERELISLLSEDTLKSPPQQVDKYCQYLTNFDEIEEIKL
ncbi:hypothetical protein Sta7437_4567 (plasmid) [Stanieria cyanosphaera PCC 7437]|uniref:Uncharacterized protein n=1 Tax=Stanieria cyanosphaera (strain ATCC 29371 / PCC 7437) TaxID=111780 RepID=K9Y0V8_STAC7|nr:hypothetical protein [Stanieria cyanosphaera]AFZ38026.1 hypothetical protein Sta7437_4567 [Stanieria cyanosphaera PCC 7437]